MTPCERQLGRIAGSGLAQARLRVGENKPDPGREEREKTQGVP